MFRPALALTLVLTLLAGCGGEEEADAGAVPPAAEARAAMERYWTSFQAGDAEGLCGTLAEATRERLEDNPEDLGCTELTDAIFARVPAEVRRGLELVAGTPRVDGTRATVPVRVGGPMALRARSTTTAMVAEDGAWRLAELPGPTDPNADGDQVAECVVSGLETEPDPYWEQEGRADRVEYLRRVCRALARRGSDAGDREVLERVAGRVILDMVREGRIRKP